MGAVTKRGNHPICPRRPHKQGYRKRFSVKAHRHQHVDRLATENALFLGILKDARSFISRDGHVFLKGVDMSTRRHEVFERDKGICQQRIAVLGDRTIMCGRFVDEEYGEVDHVTERSKGGCDCLHNLRWSERGCHRARHGRTIRKVRLEAQGA